MELTYSKIDGKSRAYKILVGALAFGVVMLFVSFIVAYLMGHQVWGANNRIPWGQPVILLIYFIGLSAGAIVVSSLGYVFKKDIYKPIGRIAVYLGLLMMIGAMVSVIADLGRAEKFWRLFMFFYLNNMQSMFAINGVLYGGYIVLMIIYLWAVMEGKTRFAMIIGIVDVIWAIGVHTGTGSIFASMGNRELMLSSLRPFEFIVAALSSGTAALILVVVATYKFTKRQVNRELVVALGRLLIIFMATLALMIFFDKMVHNYFPHRAPTEFLFSGPYWYFFWLFQIGAGIVVPLIIVSSPAGRTVRGVVIAAAFVVVGVLGERISLVIPGTALPQPLYPGHIEGIWGQASIFQFTFWETMLSLGIVCLVGLLYVLGLKYLELAPSTEFTGVVPEPLALAEEAAEAETDTEAEGEGGESAGAAAPETEAAASETEAVEPETPEPEASEPEASAETPAETAEVDDEKEAAA